MLNQLPCELHLRINGVSRECACRHLPCDSDVDLSEWGVSRIDEVHFVGHDEFRERVHAEEDVEGLVSESHTSCLNLRRIAE